MIEVSRSLYRACVFVVVVAAVFTSGCSKKPVTSTQPSTRPSAPPPAQPRLALQPSPTPIEPGDSSSLSWTSPDATQLTIAPDVGSVTAQGSTKGTPSSSTSYTITARG